MQSHGVYPEALRQIRFTVAPGNAGIAEYAECVNIGAMEFEKTC